MYLVDLLEKTNFRVALETYVAAHNKRENSRCNLSDSDTATDFLTDFMTGEVPNSPLLSEGETGIYWHPSGLSSGLFSGLSNAVEVADALPDRVPNGRLRYENAGEAAIGARHETVYSGVSMRAASLEINTDAQSPTFYPPSLVNAYAIHQFIDRLSYGESSADSFAYRSSAQIIDLSPLTASNVRLSQWFQGRFEVGWQSLERLFELSLIQPCGCAVPTTCKMKHLSSGFK